jgi:hypothetical protein
LRIRTEQPCLKVWSFWCHSKYHIWSHLFQVSLRMRDRFLKWLSSNGNTEILRFRSDVWGMFGHNQSNPRVSQSPTGYMLRSFRFYLLLWSTFYRFLGNDPSSSQSLELQPVISETRVVHLWLVVGSPRPLFRSDCFQSIGHYCITWIRCLKWLASSECQNLWSVRYRWTWMSLRYNWLKIKTAGIWPIVLGESIQYTPI